MAKKVYRFSHGIRIAVVLERIGSAVESIAQKYGLTTEELGAGAYRLHRSGVEAQISVHEDAVVVEVDLNWFLEKAVRQPLEDALHAKIPPLLS